MRIARAASCLFVLSCLVGAPAWSCDLEPCESPPVIAPDLEHDEAPPGPARIVDEGFNEIAATDDDDPTLKLALAAYGARAEALAADRVAAEEEQPQAAAARLVPSMPVFSAGALLVLFMLGCVAVVGRRAAAPVATRSGDRGDDTPASRLKRRGRGS